MEGNPATIVGLLNDCCNRPWPPRETWMSSSRRFGDKTRRRSATTISVGPPPREYWKTRRWEDQSAGLVRTTSTIATRSFSFCQRRVWAWYFLSLSPFFFLRSFCPRKGPLPPVISPYLTRLIYASLLLYNLSLSTRVSSFNQIGPSAFLGGRFLTTEIKNHSDERSRLTLFIFEFCFEECMYMYMYTRIPLFHRLSLVVHFYKQSVGIADKLSNTNVRFLLKKNNPQFYRNGKTIFRATMLLLLLIATLGVEKINPPFVLVSPVLRMRENWSSDRGSRPLSREQAVPTATSMHREGAFVIHE